VSTAPRKASLFSLSKAALFSAPLHFLILQLPEASSDVLEKLFPSGEGQGPLFWRVAILFPYFCIASTAASALTFASVFRQAQKQPLTLRYNLKIAREKMGILVPVSLLLGLVTLLGFVALIIPGIYFMAIFLFVPPLIISEPPLPWSVYLSKSKKIAKTAIWQTLAIVTVFFLINFAVFAQSSFVESELNHWFGASMISSILALAATAVLSIIIGAFVNVWIAFYFLSLKEKMNS